MRQPVLRDWRLQERVAVHRVGDVGVCVGQGRAAGARRHALGRRPDARRADVRRGHGHHLGGRRVLHPHGWAVFGKPDNLRACVCVPYSHRHVATAARPAGCARCRRRRCARKAFARVRGWSVLEEPHPRGPSQPLAPGPGPTRARLGVAGAHAGRAQPHGRGGPGRLPVCYWWPVAPPRKRHELQHGRAVQPQDGRVGARGAPAVRAGPLGPVGGGVPRPSLRSGRQVQLWRAPGPSAMLPCCRGRVGIQGQHFQGSGA